MSRLIKAEVYRFCHSNHFAVWLAVLCCVFVTVFGTSSTDVLSMDMGEMLSVFGETCLTMPVFISIFPAIVVGVGYMRKTAYYEVMAGNRISHILFSKIIVDAVTVAVCAFISACVIPVMVYIQNGIGDATQVIERFALFFVILLHVCVISVLTTTALKHIGAAVLIYMRFSMLDILVSWILTLIADGMSEWHESLANWLVTVQVSKLFAGEITSELAVAVFGSFLLEAAVWYIASYIGMKKKIYG